jgi:uracil-DNA glycosylase
MRLLCALSNQLDDQQIRSENLRRDENPRCAGEFQPAGTHARHARLTLRGISQRLRTMAADRNNLPINTLATLRRAEAECTRCPLYQFATQVVPGEGPLRAALMLVGEQPGDQEDLAGAPFVGPAGRILDRALQHAGIDRAEVFVTNAVKHFKHEMRGKRRLHKRPNVYEIERCRWWLEQEREIVHPAAIVALGATAARSVLGRTVSISRTRGQPQRLADGTATIVTIHPSFLLRIEDAADKEREYESFVSDLREAAKVSAVAGLA